MQGSCGCHHEDGGEKQKPRDNVPPGLDAKIEHTVGVFQKFLSPYKVLYLLDPVQADLFKSRNSGNGCCVANHITIPNAQLTPTEKILKELVSARHLRNNLEAILLECSARYTNIIEGGQRDKLQVTPQVQKFVLDKVLGECVTQFVLRELGKRLAAEGAGRSKQIGLWATPATWKQKYPHIPLEFIPPNALGQLLTRGWTVISLLPNADSLRRELQLLEKDGKFEERTWVESEGEKGNFKVMANPEKYADMVDTQGERLFPCLRQAAILLTALPFELNAKANLFCTVSQNIHAVFAKGNFVSKKQKDPLRFAAVLNAGPGFDVEVGGEKLAVGVGSVLLLESGRSQYCMSFSGSELFLLRSFIDVAQSVK